MPDVRPSDHLNLFLIVGDMKPPAQISLIACPPFFSQHNAYPLPICNVIHWIWDVIYMIGKTSYCHLYDIRHEKFKEEALKVMPVISSAKKFTVDWFQGFPLRMKEWRCTIIIFCIQTDHFQNKVLQSYFQEDLAQDTQTPNIPTYCFYIIPIGYLS